MEKAMKQRRYVYQSWALRWPDGLLMMGENFRPREFATRRKARHHVLMYEYGQGARPVRIEVVVRPRTVKRR
jgi:hypothetical protein